MKNVGKLMSGTPYWLYPLFVLFLSSASIAAELTSSVDRTQVDIDETLTLTVRYNAETNSIPDFSLLEKSFEILSRSPLSQVYNINGRVSIVKQWTISLAPIEPGKHLIPSFNIDGEFSDAIEITVTDASSQITGKPKEVFVETLIDKTEAYVQEQITLTYRLYYAINLDALDSDDLQLDNVNIETLPDARYRKNINGVDYLISEYKYALFPQTSEELTIPAQRWSVRINKSSRSRSVFDFNTGRYETRRLRTQSKKINIKPQPDGFPKNAPWLPASKIELKESWGNDPQKMRVGEPITRTLTLTAEGLTASQLPKIMNEPITGGVKLYQDQPKLNNEASNAKGILSQRSESAAVVLNQATSTSLPSIKIPWWDTQNDTLKYAELPPSQLRSSGSPPSAQPEMGRADLNTGEANTTNEGLLPLESGRTHGEIQKLENQLLIWRCISFFLTLIILALLALILFRKNNRGSNSLTLGASKQSRADLTKHQALKALKRSCKANDPVQTRLNLITWARLYWPSSDIHTLSDIADRTDDTALKEQLFALDATLYGQTSTAAWQGRIMLQQVQRMIDQKETSKTKNVLPDLYPINNNE